MNIDKPIRIVIIDDHPLMRDGVLLAVSAEPDMISVIEGETAEDAVNFAHTYTPAIMLIDLNIPGSGLTAIGQVLEASPKTRIIVLTESNDEDSLAAALRAGAHGYVVKGISARDLIAIIRQINNGKQYVPPDLASSLLMDMVSIADEPSPQDLIANLTEREQAVLAQLTTGASNRDIAERLYLTENTVKSYMSSVLQKLKVRNRLEAAMIAHTAGLVPPPATNS